ncbi:MAG: phospholipase D-like domain-containing protein [Microthrixaceae bacterium]
MPGTRRPPRWILLPFVAVALLVPACSSSENSSSTTASTPASTGGGGTRATTEGAQGVTIAVQPDDQGRTLLDAIGRATTSVSITVYEIDAPQINQALVDAVRRGVDVRLVLNGQWWGGTSTKYAYDLQSVLASAAAQPGAGTVDVHWSSNNFQITHQKTVLVDALDGSGKVIDPGDLPPTAVAMVLTGNLNAYGYQSYQPASSCEAPCNFWSARDFYMAVTDTTMVNEIATVFASDFACDGRTVTNGLRDTELALTWSNGSTGVQRGDDPGEYPADGKYPYFPDEPAQPAPDGPDPGPGTDQGNVRARMLQVINGATERLDVVNEEMADPQTVDALAAASQRLGAGKVRVVMTGAVNAQNSYAAAYNQLVAAGAVVHLFPNSNDVLYIHAKAIVADGATAYVGSTNISSPSMNFNRELGLLFTDQPDVLAPVLSTFEKDFADPVAVPWTPQPLPTTTTTATSTTTTTPPGTSAAGTAGRAPAAARPVGAFTPPMTCGPVTPPTPWPPASTTTTTTTTVPGGPTG